MNTRKLVAGLIVSILGVGSLVGVGTQIVSSRQAEPVQASSSISDTVYLELDSGIWGSASAYYTIHYWGGSNGSSWPGTPLNGNSAASGNTVISATWDTASTHVIIIRWGDAAHTSEWNRWSYYDANSFTAGSYNYFKNDSWSNCASSLVYENTGTIYFGNKNSWSNVYAYIYHPSYSGIYSLGAWPGTQITDADSDITFDGESGLYRLSFTKALGTTIIFHNNAGSQTANLSLVTDGYYKTDYLTTGDSERGTAANFVYNLNVARKAVVASGEIKEDSLCGISSGTAATLCTTYNAFSSTIKGHVNSATIFTYEDQESTVADTNISVSSMMQQLSSIGDTPLAAKHITISDNEQSVGLTIAIVISITTLLVLGGYYLLKKKRI
ncbi:MAG TPA: starch-binding protein [Bacilli bacterium]|nr:starch-binding protein [Bacilli bacterium]HPS19179.1 starch-binding protein [Bacilli bacterium]